MTELIPVRASSIKLFQACPRKWKLQVKYPEANDRSPALSFGTAVHRALEQYHDRDTESSPLSSRPTSRTSGSRMSSSCRSPSIRSTDRGAIRH